ncbi:hypothetical protein BC739_004406 [Kutzneria viridogrisea]|uniref:Uncharacterized protein n=1 Tax=Kutzneria viridogrisea TaxID=47990 RepID=A0ABR6BJY1_9PSEU|nr:hypothetical protein [Kutzneria viridogrisea]
MLVRSALGAATAPATSEVATPPHVPLPRAGQCCEHGLDLGLDELDALSMHDRRTWLRHVESHQVSRLVTVWDRWRNIEGVLEFFRDRGVGESGSWASIVDAAILEGIERGTAIALGVGQDTFGNPGSTEWANYLLRLQAGRLTKRSVHDAAWSRAEQTATEYGVALAKSRGVRPTGPEWRFFQFSQVYRWLLRNEPTALLALGGPLVSPRVRELRVPFLTWFTDVRSDVPAYRGSAMAWSLAELHPVGGALDALNLLLAYLPTLFEDFLRDTGH